ncbi:MAG: CYTH domain-containing protein [Candidatus Azobacteroides pseudotrichonymphae]|jgi:CYTH domain-containing protein|nr:CYTH domain-containing protein [Bacteroidales bacterium OttesenSCG-928-I14]GMO34644.1 MAG: CYTH domain-containing protein [Candidatus Azobacteroides pseudotrichonymphae]
MKENNIEIERKFLVAGNFYPYVAKKERIIQAYLMISPQRTIRVRIKDTSASLTIKGANNINNFSHYEYEYSIPVDEARKLIQLCLPGKIEKDRYHIPFKNHIFEVDVFHGQNEGLIIAELELPSENTPFELPKWLGREVTKNPKYCNVNLINRT